MFNSEVERLTCKVTFCINVDRRLGARPLAAAANSALGLLRLEFFRTKAAVQTAAGGDWNLVAVRVISSKVGEPMGALGRESSSVKRS